MSSEMKLRKHSRGETAQKPGGDQTSDNYDVTSYSRTSAAAPSATREVSGSREADAVVGAAVRGGSLLMLLALLQVRQAREWMPFKGDFWRLAGRMRNDSYSCIYVCVW